jgi:AraC-like DNA-binding protein
MELAEIARAAPCVPRIYDFEEWSADLQSVCGVYRPTRFARRGVVNGQVLVRNWSGVEIAHIANDLGQVRRDHADIRRDYGEHFFLLIQLEGMCGIEQRERRSVIVPGDCVLVDSSIPSIFHFNGNFSNHLSVHMPRQLLFAENSKALEVSRRLESTDPMCAMLCALVAKLAGTSTADRRAPHLRKLLFDATRQAFATDDELERAPVAATSGERLEIVQVLIDRHLTYEHLTPRWLADKLGVSLRTLQDDFSILGTTATSHIRLRRLCLVRDQLVQTRDSGERPNIAEMAYKAGFNDISYFNRCFRKFFDCSPRDLLNE